MTLSVPTPWPLYQSPRVEVGVLLSAQASDAARLQPDGWLMRGSLITVSLPLTANVPVHLNHPGARRSYARLTARRRRVTMVVFACRYCWFTEGEAMAYDDADKDYECYLLGCRSARIEPVGLWRFRLLQEAYLRHAAEAEQDAQGDQIPELVLKRLATLVAEGYKIMAGYNAEGDEPGAAACGVREPRVPLEPVLVGCAARALPMLDAPDEAFWRV